MNADDEPKPLTLAELRAAIAAADAAQVQKVLARMVLLFEREWCSGDHAARQQVLADARALLGWKPKA